MDPQVIADYSLECIQDMQAVAVQRSTGYLGWFQSGSGGNWTQLSWRKNGVTIILSAFGDWPGPSETERHQLDAMALKVAESL